MKNDSGSRMEMELARLERIAKDSQYAKGVNYHVIEYSARIFERFILRGSILELGPAEGVMTERLLRICPDVTVVEGSSEFCRSLAERYPGLKVENSLFENYSPDRQFDNIVLGHVLEHVIDPVEVLRKTAGWLAPSGRIMAACPNKRSIHRQAGVMLGLLEREDGLNESDICHGHRRVYDPESFRADFRLAGFDVEIFGGYFLKTLSNKQIEMSWTQEMISAYMALGERYPDIASNIYIIARKKME